jgi:hypothetical protein
MNPWWQVDLGSECSIECLKIFNRNGNQFIRSRLFPLKVELSVDGEHFIGIDLIEGDFSLECADGVNIPYDLIPRTEVSARYVKLSIQGGPAPLHLAAVKVFGAPLESVLNQLASEAEG